jgi:aspartate carbamoyltransferase catalytic subunit
MTQEGDSMFDELSRFNVKLMLRDPADLTQYKQIITKIRETDFVNILDQTLREALSSQDLLLLVKPKVERIK